MRSVRRRSSPAARSAPPTSARRRNCPRRGRAGSGQGVSAPGERWWTLYGDPALDRLVEEALAHNQDLALAVGARGRGPRARRGSPTPSVMPSVDASFNRDAFSQLRGRVHAVAPRHADREQRLSRAVERRLRGGPVGPPEERQQCRARQPAGDRGGARDGAHRARHRGRARLLHAASRSTRRSPRPSARSICASNGLELQKVRAKAGLINEFSLRQLEAEVAAAQAQLPALEANRTAQELALAVLVGRSPRAITEGSVERRAEQGEPQAARRARGTALRPAAAPSRHRRGRAAPDRRQCPHRGGARGALPAHRADRISRQRERGARQSLLGPGDDLVARVRARAADLPGRAPVRGGSKRSRPASGRRSRSTRRRCRTRSAKCGRDSRRRRGRARCTTRRRTAPPR